VGIVALYTAAMSENAISSYVYKYIDSEVKNFIRLNMKQGVTGVSKKSFWNMIMGRHKLKRQKGIDDQEFMSHTIDSLDRQIGEDLFFHEVVPDLQLDTEQTLIRKENRAEVQIMSLEVGKFYLTLPMRERIIFQKRIIAKEPMSTRQLATYMGVKSNKTVSNIEDKILDKARRYFA
jgi:hypothetical protein